MRLVKRAIGLTIVALCAGIVLLEGIIGCAPAKSGRQNLVFITLDTFRADRMDLSEGGGSLTPQLAGLARQASVFSNAVAPMGTTHPSHASMFTGLYPGDHGVHFNADPLDSSQITLAELLSEAGYETASFVSKRSMLIRGGLIQGFEVTSDAVGKWEGDLTRIRSGLDVNRKVEQWLKDYKGGQPLFLWEHYFDAHSPYRLTPYAQRQLSGYEGPLAQGASTELFHSFGSEELPATAENHRALEALYDGEVVEVDRHVGELPDMLKDHGILDNAILVLVGDHGQLLGERGLVGHGGRLWEPLLRAPLLIWDSNRKTHRQVPERVSLTDLMPTTLDLLGLPPQPGIAGRSVAPALEGQSLSDVPCFATVRTPNLTKKKSLAKLARGELQDRSVAAYLGDYKLILKDGNEVFLHLAGQQGEVEIENPDPDQLEILGRLRALAVHHQELEVPITDPDNLPPDVLNELRELGYLKGG